MFRNLRDRLFRAMFSEWAIYDDRATRDLRKRRWRDGRWEVAELTAEERAKAEYEDMVYHAIK